MPRRTPPAGIARCHSYFFLTPDDLPEMRGDLESECRQYYERLPNRRSLIWRKPTVDHLDHPAKSLFHTRPEARWLNAALLSGDHVILPRLDRGPTYIKCFRQILELWETHGVIGHILDLGVNTNDHTGEALTKALHIIAVYHRGEPQPKSKSRRKRPGRIEHDTRDLAGLFPAATPAGADADRSNAITNEAKRPMTTSPA